MAGTHIKRHHESEDDEKHEEVEEKKVVVHRHPATPAYYPRDDRYAIELDPDTYRPRDLLNLCVKSFWLRDDESLNLRQKNARKGFCHQYADGLQHFDRPVDGGDAHLAAAQQACVNNLKRYLDEFFFFEQLRRRLDLTAGIDVVKADDNGGGGVVQPDWDGYTDIRAGRCRLRINVGRGDRAFPLLAVVETLVHEMAHAYLMVFSDQRCDMCRRDRLNTVGVDGHGPVFLQLHRLMVTQVRRWHDDLSKLAEADCPGDTMASIKARELANAAVVELSHKERMLYNKRVLRDNSYIRQTAKGNVIVRLEWLAKSLIAEEEFDTKQRNADDVEALRAMMRRQTLENVIREKRSK